MVEIAAVCTLISTVFLVNPWRVWPWCKRRYWRLRRLIEDRREHPEPDDPIERFLQSRANGAPFTTDRLYE